MSDQETPAIFISEANAIISGEQNLPDPEQLEELIEELKGELKFGLARKVLTRAREEGAAEKILSPWITQQLALCTYKDEDLPPFNRLDDALQLLESLGLRAPDKFIADELEPVELPAEELATYRKLLEDSVPETLALGGAVYKRIWEYRGQSENLRQSYEFYRAAWDRDNKLDLGYGGVNAAYVLDLLAARAHETALRSGTRPTEANRLQETAGELRNAILKVLLQHAKDKPEDKKSYWYQVTLAEIRFGLRQFPAAGKCLSEAKKADAKPWKRQTTFMQFASLARLQGDHPPREGQPVKDWPQSWQVLGKFLNPNEKQAIFGHRGKVGLALSGGGFRASFYHLGVLARLAEMDVLRSVEVLSTVSGGSIVGAMYYLEVQKKLEEKSDAQIGKADYITIVETVSANFLAGVQQNIRMRVMADFWKNLRMLFSGKLFKIISDKLPEKYDKIPDWLKYRYSRTHRLGELYEEKLYRLIRPDIDPETGLPMEKLLVTPAPYAKGTNYNPKFANWSRRAKVPILLLNTTSLNSGHNWHFTASWMGEAPGLLGSEVDKNRRYRRLYYEKQAPVHLQDFRLGHAVAASSCVPGLFDPLAIEALYEEVYERPRTRDDDHVLQLVDGGVHDNQGVQGLLNEGCNLIICSDASGQMKDEKTPGDSMISVLLRSSCVQGDRVREAEYQDLLGRVENGALQDLCYIHLKKDLDAPAINWLGLEEKPQGTDPQETTDYGIAKDLQDRIAAIRTDLDSFTEVEACSLMCSGYLTVENQLRTLAERHRQYQLACIWDEFELAAPRDTEKWEFLRLAPLLASPAENGSEQRKELIRQLEIATKTAFKVWAISPELRKLAKIALAVAVILLLVAIVILWNFKVTFALSTIFIAALGAVAAAVFPLYKLFVPQKTAKSIIIKAGIATFGWALAKVHLHWFDKLFLEQGELDRLLRKKG